MLLCPEMGLKTYNRYAAPAGSSVNARWDNLIAGWHLDEESDGSGGVTRADVLGTYDLTDINTTPSTLYLFSNGANPAGANAESLEYLITPSSTEWLAKDVRTVCGWMRFNTASGVGDYARLFYLESTQYGRQVSVYVDRWKSMFALWRDSTGGDSEVQVNGLLNDTDYFVVAWLDDTNTAHLSINDTVYDAPGAIPGTMLAVWSGSQPRLWVAKAEGAMTAKFAEVHAFSVTKDAAWRTDMYNSGAGRAYPN